MYISPAEAIKIQKELADRVIKQDSFTEINYVAGADVSNPPYSKREENDSSEITYAAICVFSYPDLNLIEQASHSEVIDFPYIPGLLAFREAPSILGALKKLNTKPDIIILDGHGISHPRKLGIASHIGVTTDNVTIGCAKSIMIGKPEKELPEEKGSYVHLIYKGEVVGNVVRTKTRINPVYVSIGNKITLEKATEIILACTTKYKLPEPTRQAHQYANFVRVKDIKSGS